MFLDRSADGNHQEREAVRNLAKLPVDRAFAVSSLVVSNHATFPDESCLRSGGSACLRLSLKFSLPERLFPDHYCL